MITTRARVVVVLTPKLYHIILETQIFSYYISTTLSNHQKQTPPMSVNKQLSTWYLYIYLFVYTFACKWFILYNFVFLFFFFFLEFSLFDAYNCYQLFLFILPIFLFIGFYFQRTKKCVLYLIYIFKCMIGSTISSSAVCYELFFNFILSVLFFLLLLISSNTTEFKLFINCFLLLFWPTFCINI